MRVRAVFRQPMRKSLILIVGAVLWLGGQAFGTRQTPRQHVSSRHRSVRRVKATLPQKPSSRARRRRVRVRWTPVFRPSRDSLLRQNAEVDRLELPRIQDDDELEQLKATNELVPLRESDHLHIAPQLPVERRYCRPWTRDFVEDLSREFRAEFGHPIQLNSAVRTVKVQKKLRRRNRNAAPAEGETASSHLAGITVDLQRRGLTQPELHWVQLYLIKLKALGLIEPEEERRHWCFHVMVSDRYSDYREARELASRRPAPRVDAPAVEPAAPPDNP